MLQNPEDRLKKKPGAGVMLQWAKIKNDIYHENKRNRVLNAGRFVYQVDGDGEFYDVVCGVVLFCSIC